MAQLLPLNSSDIVKYKGAKVVIKDNPLAQWVDAADPLIVKLVPLAIGPAGPPGPAGPGADLSNLELPVDPALIFLNALI